MAFLLQHHNLGADRHPLKEIFDMFVDHANAAIRDRTPD
jgi:hypothetical protein